nr:uracil-DNA glycosylase [Paenibacillus paridis]
MIIDNHRINCLKCKHYYITWDPKSPKGCKAFGFKSSAMPSIAVFASSGKPCMNFEHKIQAQA